MPIAPIQATVADKLAIQGALDNAAVGIGTSLESARSAVEKAAQAIGNSFASLTADGSATASNWKGLAVGAATFAAAAMPLAAGLSPMAQHLTSGARGGEAFGSVLSETTATAPAVHNLSVNISSAGDALNTALQLVSGYIPDVRSLGAGIGDLGAAAISAGESLASATQAAANIGNAIAKGTLATEGLNSAFAVTIGNGEAMTTFASGLDMLGIKATNSAGELLPLTDLIGNAAKAMKANPFAEGGINFAFKAFAAHVPGIEAAAGALGKLGIKAVDAKGNLLPFSDIFTSVATSLASGDLMGGAMDTLFASLAGKAPSAANAFATSLEALGVKARGTGGELLSARKLVGNLGKGLSDGTIYQKGFTLAASKVGAGLSSLGTIGTKVMTLLSTGLRILGVAFMSNPIGLVLGGIAIAAGLVMANWDAVSGFFGRLFSWLGEKLGGVLDLFKLAFSFSPLELIIGAWGKVSSYFAGLLDTIGSLFTDGWDYITSLFNVNPLDALAAVWEPIVGFFSDIFGNIASMMDGAVGKALSWLFGDDEEKAQSTAKPDGIFGKLRNAVVGDDEEEARNTGESDGIFGKLRTAVFGDDEEEAQNTSEADGMNASRASRSDVKHALRDQRPIGSDTAAATASAQTSLEVGTPRPTSQFDPSARENAPANTYEFNSTANITEGIARSASAGTPAQVQEFKPTVNITLNGTADAADIARKVEEALEALMQRHASARHATMAI